MSGLMEVGPGMGAGFGGRGIGRSDPILTPDGNAVFGGTTVVAGSGTMDIGGRTAIKG